MQKYRHMNATAHHPLAPITGTTQLFGIIGRDVSYSLSPAIHNALLADANIAGAYLPFPTPDITALQHLLHYARRSAIRGFNVTIPYKEEVIPLLHELDPLARAAGAVNTIVIRDERLHGYNTDGLGFLQSLLSSSGADSLQGASVTLLGAGGAARGIAPALIQQGVSSLTIVNRTPARAEALVESLRAIAPNACTIRVTTELEPCHNEWVINTTSAGMKQERTALFTEKLIRDARYFADIVYTPAHTVNMEIARRAGVPHSNGLGMLVWQALVAFELFTGHKGSPECAFQAVQEFTP
ncbi:shikimate dehydrogenase [Chrysiogenes arsenatis]|uniref:shikimate dehydrogenase n=1 Tax=Chrysiogenes arsenatis TaxID=309797 RepID=UPI00040BAC90|nr:shikimate dehydrogenase [Chrysiogenes arsenatis]